MNRIKNMLGRKWTFPSLNYDYITLDQRVKHEEFKRNVTIMSLMFSLSARGISQFLLQAACKLQTLNLDLSLKLIVLFWKKNCALLQTQEMLRNML